MPRKNGPVRRANIVGQWHTIRSAWHQYNAPCLRARGRREGFWRFPSVHRSTNVIAFLILWKIFGALVNGQALHGSGCDRPDRVYCADSERVRGMVEHCDIIEIFCECTSEVCESRDVRASAKKASAGQAKGFTGVPAPNEAPVHSNLLFILPQRH